MKPLSDVRVLAIISCLKLLSQKRDISKLGFSEQALKSRSSLSFEQRGNCIIIIVIIISSQGALIATVPYDYIAPPTF